MDPVSRAPEQPERDLTDREPDDEQDQVDQRDEGDPLASREFRFVRGRTRCAGLRSSRAQSIPRASWARPPESDRSPLFPARPASEVIDILGWGCAGFLGKGAALAA